MPRELGYEWTGDTALQERGEGRRIHPGLATRVRYMFWRPYRQPPSRSRLQLGNGGLFGAVADTLSQGLENKSMPDRHRVAVALAAKNAS